MRKHINNNLVFTTSRSETKRNYAFKNKKSNVKFIMTSFGKKKDITEEEYKKLKSIGYQVDMVIK